LFGAIAPGR
jgi:hypothetical protein